MIEAVDSLLLPPLLDRMGFFFSLLSVLNFRLSFMKDSIVDDSLAAGSLNPFKSVAGGGEPPSTSIDL